METTRSRPQRSTCCCVWTAVLTPPVQQLLILERLLHRIRSCRSAADDASMFSCRNTGRTQTCDRNCTTSFRNTHHKHCTEPWRNDTSNVSHLPIRPARSWHRPRHLGLSCHVLCHGLEDEIWWHSVTKHMPVVSALLRLRTQSVQFGSDTVPHQLEKKNARNSLDTDMSKCLPSNHKKYHKSRDVHCTTT